MNTVAVDPLRTLRPLREEEIALLTTSHEPAGAPPLAYDVYRNGDELVIEFDAPGVAPSEISVAVEGRAVVVSLRRELVKGPGIDVIESGRPHGSFRQRLWLGDRWDVDSLRADAAHGVLTLTAPLAARLMPRAVEVAAAAPTPGDDPMREEGHVGPVIAAEPVHSAA
jgi:HSP20 family protein